MHFESTHAMKSHIRKLSRQMQRDLTLLEKLLYGYNCSLDMTLDNETIVLTFQDFIQLSHFCIQRGFRKQVFDGRYYTGKHAQSACSFGFSDVTKSFFLRAELNHITIIRYDTCKVVQGVCRNWRRDYYLRWGTARLEIPEKITFSRVGESVPSPSDKEAIRRNLYTRHYDKWCASGNRLKRSVIRFEAPPDPE